MNVPKITCRIALSLLALNGVLLIAQVAAADKIAQSMAGKSVDELCLITTILAFGVIFWLIKKLMNLVEKRNDGLLAVAKSLESLREDIAKRPCIVASHIKLLTEDKKDRKDERP